MSVEIWTDNADNILSVKARFENVPINGADAVVLGRDSLRTAEIKLGDRFVGKSSSTYIVELDCQGFYIGAKSKDSSKWDIN